MSNIESLTGQTSGLPVNELLKMDGLGVWRRYEVTWQWLSVERERRRRTSPPEKGLVNRSVENRLKAQAGKERIESSEVKGVALNLKRSPENRG